jgi:transcription-repair coupling factor (superfamily II helicase)
MKLLEQTVRELRGEDVEDDVRATVNVRVDMKIDEGYIPDMNQRLTIYRNVAGARSEEELARTLEEVRDRYGPPPDSVLNLAEYGRIRIIADRLGVEAIDREGRLAVIKFRPQARVDPVRLLNVIHEWPGAVFVPPVSVRLDLEAPSETRPAALSHRPTTAAPATSPPVSWWTARATSGEVRAGFTREEILRRPDADPRGQGGMFSRLEGLLRALL